METRLMKPLSLKAVAVLCAAASAATIAFAAMAQDGPPPSGGPGGQFAQGRGSGGRLGGDPAQRMQQLHDSLQITSAQEPAFQAWQAALKPAGMAARPGAMRRMTTPQRLDEALNEQTARDGELKARVAATKSFYNQLTATQRQTMDGLPPQELLAIEAMGPGGGRGGLAGRGGPGGRRGGGGGNFDPNGGFGGPQNFGGTPAQ
jgi:protein CpxP